MEWKLVMQEMSYGFDALTADDIPPEEKRLDRLEDESLTLFIAGHEITARTMMVAAFYLANNRLMALRLREELKTVMPTSKSRAPWSQLEGLPYSTGVVNEAIRLSQGATMRSARISPVEATTYQDKIIPPGTPVSQSTYFVNMDPTIFPTPEAFNPERWIQASEKGENLNRFLASFSKGSRQCIGINLAYAELYITLAMVARRFDMKLYDTTVENITTRRDRIAACPEVGSWSVKVTVDDIVED